MREVGMLLEDVIKISHLKLQWIIIVGEHTSIALSFQKVILIVISCQSTIWIFKTVHWMALTFRCQYFARPFPLHGVSLNDLLEYRHVPNLFLSITLIYWPTACNILFLKIWVLQLVEKFPFIVDPEHLYSQEAPAGSYLELDLSSWH